MNEKFEVDFQSLLAWLPRELRSYVAIFFSNGDFKTVALINKSIKNLFLDERIELMSNMVGKRLDFVLKDLLTILVGNDQEDILKSRAKLNKAFLKLQEIFNQNQIHTLLLKKIFSIKYKEKTANYKMLSNQIVKPYLHFFPEKEVQLKRKVGLTGVDSPLNWDELLDNKEIRYHILCELVNFFSEISRNQSVRLEEDERFNVFYDINIWLENVKGLYNKPYEYELLKWLKAVKSKSLEMQLSEVLRQEIEEKANPRRPYQYESTEFIGAIIGGGTLPIMLWIILYLTKGADHPLFYPLTVTILAVAFFCVTVSFGEYKYLDYRNNKEFYEIKSNFFQPEAAEDNAIDNEDLTSEQIMRNF